MAFATLLNAVSVNTEGTAVEITGDFEALALGTHYAGGQLELQVSDLEAGTYHPVGPDCQWNGPGSPVTVKNSGTKWFRGVYKGKQASMGTPSVTLKYEQT